MEGQSPEKQYPDEAIYGKLVRDGIVGRIEADGLTAETKELSPEETIRELKTKSVEEARELAEAAEIEDVKKEMADLLEVIRSLAEELNLEMSEVE